MTRGLTAAEIGAFLGVSAAAIRQTVSRRQIAPIGKEGRANLYNPTDVLRHMGTRDRQAG